MKTVGLIGFGAIGRYIVKHWASAASDYRLTHVLGRTAQLDDMRKACGAGTLVTDRPDEFLDDLPDIVIEAAGHTAVKMHGPAILAAGRELYLLSIGVTADQECIDLLKRACQDGGGRISMPAGALAGFDGLLALHASGLRRVCYTSRKPAFAWKGTPGAALYDLGTIETAMTIFEGSARDAAKLYPKNANLAAAVAMAGLGLDDTNIVLIADPDIHENIGEIEAEGDLGRLFVRVSGEADPHNPKTSVVVGASVLSALANQSSIFRYI